MMLPHEAFRALLPAGPPLLALAPMQEVTDGAFWTLIHRYGGADVYWTEYFRVHADSTPEKWIVDSIVHNTTGRPVVAQMIGNDVPALVRTARVLQQLPDRRHRPEPRLPGADRLSQVRRRRPAARAAADRRDPRRPA